MNAVLFSFQYFFLIKVISYLFVCFAQRNKFCTHSVLTNAIWLFADLRKETGAKCFVLATFSSYYRKTRQESLLFFPRGHPHSYVCSVSLRNFAHRFTRDSWSPDLLELPTWWFSWGSSQFFPRVNLDRAEQPGFYTLCCRQSTDTNYTRLGWLQNLPKHPCALKCPQCPHAAWWQRHAWKHCAAEQQCRLCVILGSLN